MGKRAKFQEEEVAETHGHMEHDNLMCFFVIFFSVSDVNVAILKIEERFKSDVVNTETQTQLAYLHHVSLYLR